MVGAASDYPDDEAMAALVGSGDEDGDVVAAKVLGLRYSPPEPKYSSMYGNWYSEPAKVTLALRIRAKEVQLDIIDEVKSGFGLQRISGAAIEKMRAVLPDFLNVKIVTRDGVSSYDLVDSDFSAWVRNARVKRTRARKTAVESVLQYIAGLISEGDSFAWYSGF